MSFTARGGSSPPSDTGLPAETAPMSQSHDVGSSAVVRPMSALCPLAAAFLPMSARLRQLWPRVLRVGGSCYLAVGSVGLVGHLIRPDLATWPEVPSLGDAGGFVLDALSICFGVFLLVLTRRFRRL